MEDSEGFSMALSEDITPPLSPVLVPEEEDDERRAKRLRADPDLDIPWVAPRFDCSDHRRNVSSWRPASNGFMGTRMLARLLKERGVSMNEAEAGPIIQLFGSSFVAATALLDHRSHLFSILRQIMGKMESLMGRDSYWSLTDPLVQTFKKLREQVLQFLNYLHSFIQGSLATTNASSTLSKDDSPSLFMQRLTDLPGQLASELNGVATFMGRLSDLPTSVLHHYATSQTRQATHENLLLHFHLDVMWYIIQILHHLHMKVVGSRFESEVVHHLTRQTERLMEDVLDVATLRHNELSDTEVHQTSIFPCSCFQELCLLLIHLLDHRHTHYGGTSFWACLQQLLTQVLEKSNQDSDEGGLHPVGITPKDPVGLSWWLLQGLASIYCFDEMGQETPQLSGRSHWYLIDDLMKKLVAKDSEISEAKMQSYLRHLLALAQYWEPQTKILTSLWDYFYRKLNHRFTASTYSLQGLATISKSALSWFQTCKSRCSDQQCSQGQETSFHLFLRILACKMNKWNATGNQQPWKQLQGRLYSKFHSGTMQELSEIGLQRFFDLFLTLGLLVGLPSLTNRVLDFIDLLPTKLSIGKQLLTWRGLFALCLVHEERQCDLGAVAEKLASFFQSVTKSYIQIKSDPLRRSDLWQLITCYLEGTQEVWESSSHLAHSEEGFIDAGLGELLSAASEEELRILLIFVQTTMARHRSVYKKVFSPTSTMTEKTANALKKKYRAIADALWTHIFPFVKQHSTTQTPPQQLADVAASFTLLAADLPNQAEGEMSAWSLFHYFGLQAGKAHPSLRVRYLCHLLPNDAFMESLQPPPGAKEGDGSRECLLVRAWLHASIQLPGSPDQLRELGRLVMKLPAIRLITEVAEDTTESSQPLLRFLQLLSRYSTSAQVFQERLERRSKALMFLGDLVALVRTQVRGQRSLEEMSRMYQVVGHIVKYCGNVLYSQGSSQSQLPGILTELILFPAAFNLKKPLPPYQKSAIKETLHLFVEGLCQHDISRDSYIQRKLKEITCQYFLRYTVKSSVKGSSGDMPGSHPLLRSLSSTFKQHVDPNRSCLRRVMLSELRDRFLSGSPQQVGPHTAPAIALIQDLFYHTTSTEQIARDTVVLLGMVLDFLLLSESSSIRGQMSQLLTLMMNACKTDIPQALEHEVVSVLRSFLSRHINHHRRTSLERLESVAILHPRLVTKLIPDCTRLLQECEHRRAVGVDTVLRQAYAKVLSHLGPAGQAEMRILSSS